MGSVLLSQVVVSHHKARSKVFGAKPRFQQVWVSFAVYLYNCDSTVLFSLCSDFKAEAPVLWGLKRSLTYSVRLRSCFNASQNFHSLSRLPLCIVCVVLQLFTCPSQVALFVAQLVRIHDGYIPLKRVRITLQWKMSYKSEVILMLHFYSTECSLELIAKVLITGDVTVVVMRSPWRLLSLYYK